MRIPKDVQEIQILRNQWKIRTPRREPAQCSRCFDYFIKEPMYRKPSGYYDGEYVWICPACFPEYLDAMMKAEKKKK